MWSGLALVAPQWVALQKGPDSTLLGGHLGGHREPVIAQCRNSRGFRPKCGSHHPLEPNCTGRHRRPFFAPKSLYLTDVIVIRDYRTLQGVSTVWGYRWWYRPEHVGELPRKLHWDWGLMLLDVPYCSWPAASPAAIMKRDTQCMRHAA